MDFSSSDLMSGTLKCIFSGFLELMNSTSTSAMRSLKGRLSFISLSLTFAKSCFQQCKFAVSNPFPLTLKNDLIHI